MTFYQRHHVGIAFPNQTVSNATVNGSAITAPWEKGNEIAFVLTGSNLTTETITVGVELSADNSTWSDMYQEDGATSLAFAAQTGGDDLDLGVIFGTLDLSRISAADYAGSEDPKYMRLTVTNDTASAMWFGGAYIIAGDKSFETGQTDGLLSQQLAAL